MTTTEPDWKAAVDAYARRERVLRGFLTNWEELVQHEPDRTVKLDLVIADIKVVLDS